MTQHFRDEGAAARGLHPKDAQATSSASRPVHALFMEAPTAIAVLREPDWVIDFTNRLAQRLFRDRAAVGRRLFECAPELARSPVAELLDRAHGSGRPAAACELLILLDRGDGALAEGYFNVTLEPIPAAGGGTESVVLFAVEVTDQVLARRRIEQLAEQLEHERHKLEQIIQQMPHAVYIAEAPSGQLVTGNAQGSAQLGRPFVASTDIAAYSAAYSGFHADGRPYAPHEWPLARAVTSGELVRAEPVEMVRADGSRAIIEYSAAPIRDASGQIVAGVVVGVDATDRIRALREEQRRSEQLRGLAEASLAVNAAPSLDRMLAEITERARSLIGAHQAVISMTRDDDRAQAISAVSLSDKYAAYRGHDAKTDGSGTHTLACKLNRPLRMTQAELEAHPAWRGSGGEASRRPPLRGWLAAPLIARDGSNIGLIQLSDKIEGEFTGDDESILMQLAQLASVAIENTRLREAALAAEKRFRSMVEATAVVVWRTLPDGRVVEDSASWRGFTGQRYEEWIGYGWLDAVHPDDRERAGAAWRAAVASRGRYEVEYRLRRRDGSWAHTVARGVPLLADDGSIDEWVGCNVDVSDIRRAEEALRVQHQLVRTIAENTTLGLFMMDAHQRCTFMNPAAEKITGFTFDEIKALDRPLHEIVHHKRPDGSHYPIEECPIDRALPRKSQEQGEDVFVHKDGAFYQVAFTASPILDGAVPVGTVIEVRDITEQKRAEAERERLIAALERSNKELDQFAYVASHDLKAPLRGIANLTQWIEEDLAGTLAGDSREHMSLLRGRVRRMEALIDGILDYSRAGRVRHEVEAVDVGQVLADVVELIAPAPGARVEVSPGLPVLRTERIPLQQVFMNLISNALKHARRVDVRVRVGHRDAGQLHEFFVEDNGPGIAPEFHDRVWGLFQTLEARDKVEGTGIGLSVVKKIVESRGGRIWIDSSPGQGAAFRFTWPKRDASER
ncbi:PAS domain S-box protein [Sorangium sp. So ce1335]|uniref:PAS domain S-box protein n=1 Tax=Sorangium sp. So ce1335 TaxID=3133335 RepID=UPI003F5E1C36